MLRNEHDFIGSLNKGLDSAKGKYIARMDADDIMHVDRLKIQHAIMEEEEGITVCGTWMTHFGEDIHAGNIARTLDGLIEHPLITFLKGNFMFHPTVCMRKDFLDKHNLRYQNYDCAEDYKLWFEIAKNKGIFYIESQSLLFYRISKKQVSQTKRGIQMATSAKIQMEIIEYLISLNSASYPKLNDIYRNLIQLKNSKLLSDVLFSSFFHTLFNENRQKLSFM